MTTIEKNNLLQSFADRLRGTLIARGYCSTRTPSGVDIHRFAQLAGHSPQICRKYLRGQAIPSPEKLANIAKKLDASPGWLLFGDCHSTQTMEEHKITISKELLHYIFSYVSALSQPVGANPEMLCDFFLELTQDVSQINVDSRQSKKIVDLALFSIKQFTQNKHAAVKNNLPSDEVDWTDQSTSFISAS